MREVATYGVEARRWTVVFHREAENWFFDLIACGHFKHVSAFAWLPELEIWVFYDVGFRRTRIVHLADGVAAHAAIAAIVKGNAVVTIEARTDGLPLMRWGLFCTTAIAHLLGQRCVALRPDALYRRLIAQGGVLSDDVTQDAGDTSRPEPRHRPGEGAEGVDRQSSGAGAGRHGESDGALWHPFGTGGFWHDAFGRWWS